MIIVRELFYKKEGLNVKIVRRNTEPWLIIP